MWDEPIQRFPQQFRRLCLPLYPVPEMVGGMAMYLEAQGQPLVEEESIAPSHFTSSARGERWFCPGCGCPLWFTLTARSTTRYFIPWTQLEMSEDERRRLILAAEIYTETQPAFFGLTGQYARFSATEIEAHDKRCLLTPHDAH